MSVIARLEPRIIPTYPVGAPEKNPVFFEKRVYQGSNGKVYLVPFIDKVGDRPVDVTYQSARLENECVRLVMLPEIGGRIFLGQDKTNRDYDFFYRQDVIKPALVGLAGPWISGGVEFNWPQHHRPGTFLPADVFIEEEPDGARTVWMSEHDPLHRLKGMHGIRLRPGSSLVELRVRLFNRTPFVRTFLWWANVAARVHDQYESFFPPDVHYVADHAVRATSSFPIANNPYYGIPYQDRPGANNLAWYKNIPVPTSYMVCQTDFNFFGGYDHAARGGFVHVANRHIAPGKKQWTWGNDRFGYAWDRELTDDNGPYVELMAGVYTDNQPDFTYLLPYETKTFSQFWWPIQNIGPVQQADENAALAVSIGENRVITLGACISSSFEGELVVRRGDQLVGSFPVDLKPGESFLDSSLVFGGENPSELVVELRDRGGATVLSHRPVEAGKLTRDREQATEPAAPADIASQDELFFTGEHLELYRHPTRSPEDYWNEALARDPGDARCHLGLGKRALDRGETEPARDHFGAAITRLTSRHPNPVSGEAHYHLGLALRRLDDSEGAYAAFYKATWNYEWRGAAYYQLATLDAAKGDRKSALAHADEALETNRSNSKAIVLKALLTGPSSPAGRKLLDDLLAIDPLDHWARCVRDGELSASARNDAQTVIDLALDFSEAGFFQEAIALLEVHHAREPVPVAVPNPLGRTAMTHYLLAWLKHRVGAPDAAPALATARAQASDHFFPSRLEEAAILAWAMEGAAPEVAAADDLAAYALGNFLYDKRRHADAIAAWNMAVAAGTKIPQVYRNLGIAVWNHTRDGGMAAGFYRKAMELDPTDARLVSEADQLAAKRRVSREERLAFLENHKPLVLQRDDATVALAALHNQTGNPQAALDLVLSRRFHPWEGGEGAVLHEYTAARLLLGRAALEQGDAATALDHFDRAMETPDSLGEAYHPLQAKADVSYAQGTALRALGREAEAVVKFQSAAAESGDFSAMAVTEFSELTLFKSLALRALDKEEEAAAVLSAMRSWATEEKTRPATIDYFATSLPNLLVFDEDLDEAKQRRLDHLISLCESSHP